MATMLDRPAGVTSPASRARRRPWIVPAVLTLALAALTTVAWLALTPPAAPFHGGVIDPPTVLPDIDLQRAVGGRFATSSTRDRVSLFFFGYTTCPDVCPMALAQATQVRRLLGPQADRLDVYFVSVDPARDTPERLAAYTRAFDPAIVGLTGSPAELARAMQPFGAVAERRDTPNSPVGYLIDHSATISLVDQQSRIRLVYPPQVTPAEVAADVQRLLR